MNPEYTVGENTVDKSVTKTRPGCRFITSITDEQMERLLKSGRSLEDFKEIFGEVAFPKTVE